MGVVTAAVSLIDALVKKNPDEYKEKSHITWRYKYKKVLYKVYGENDSFGKLTITMKN